MPHQGPSRRRVLAAFSALPVAGFAGCPRAPEADPPAGTPSTAAPAPDRPPEPGPWDPDEPLDEAAFPLGVAAGDATDSAVILTVRTGEAAVGLRVVVGVGEGWEEAAFDGEVPAVEGTAQIEVVGLEPDAVYRYVFLTADGAGRSDVGRFRTALAPTSPPRKLVIGATSCLGGDNPTFPTLAHAAEHDLDLMLLLGDTVYADGSVTVEDYRAVWDEARGVASLRALLASTSVVAAWDDHEVANNWTVGEPRDDFQDRVTEAQVAAGTKAFREALPQRIGDGAPSWRALVWGDVLEVLVLDCRGERTGDVEIVSQAQLDWVRERLEASAARFKLLLVSVHITDHTLFMGTVQDLDRWQGYVEQRQALLAIAEATPGTLFVTGDMHYGAIQRVGAEGAAGAGLWEIAAGPAGSKLFPFVTIAGLLDEVPAQYDAAVEDWSWARIELDPGTGEAWVQLIDDRREVVAERRIAL
jgi:alkaline phosphatase D